MLKLRSILGSTVQIVLSVILMDVYSACSCQQAYKLKSLYNAMPLLLNYGRKQIYLRDAKHS